MFPHACVKACTKRLLRLAWVLPYLWNIPYLAIMYIGVETRRIWYRNPLHLFILYILYSDSRHIYSILYLITADKSMEDVDIPLLCAYAHIQLNLTNCICVTHLFVEHAFSSKSAKTVENSRTMTHLHTAFQACTSAGMTAFHSVVTQNICLQARFIHRSQANLPTYLI